MTQTPDVDHEALAERLRRLVPKPASPVQATIAIAVAAGILTFVVLYSHGRAKVAPLAASSIPTPTAPTPTPTPTAPAASAATARPVAVTAAGLVSAAAARGRPIYWVAARPGVRYELTQRPDGQVYVRYLPGGTALGSRRLVLTVGTYPVQNAFVVTSKAAARKGSVRVPVGGGAVGFYRRAKPDNVYLAYPGLDFQIEVFAPRRGEARRLVRSGQVRAVRTTTPTPSLVSGAPQAVSPLDLKVLSLALRHPIYWVGPRPGTTYELKQTGSELFLRYLPKGAAVGTPQLVLTVGTYSVPDAYTVTGAAAGEPGAETIDVEGGAVAFYRVYKPNNVYLAYPGQDLQIEVYSPSADEAHGLVGDGKVRPVG